MPAAAAAIVIGWTGSAAAGAIASEVVTGAIAGAVIGGVSAAISGGDILKGALRGAAVGGVSAGVLSGAGMAFSVAGGSTLEAAAGSQLGAFGLDTAGNKLATATTSTEGAATAGKGLLETAKSSAGSATTAGAGGVLKPVKPISPEVPPTPKDTSSLSPSSWSDNTGKIVAGVAQGAAAGAGQYLSAGEEAESKKELMEFERENLLADQAANVPAAWNAQTANIRVQDWWERHLSPTSTKNGGATNA